MSLAVMEKRPEDRVDYDIDFTRWLTDGDILVGASADLIDPTGASFVVDTYAFSTQVVKIWVKDGELGEEGDIFAEATTQFGRVKRATFTMRIRETC